MHWTPRRFATAIALIGAPFLTPCSGPAQPTLEDRAAIAKLAEHLRNTEGLDDHHSTGRWVVFSPGAAAAGRNYAHPPVLQFGGVLERADQDRILHVVRNWSDRSRFDRVQVFFYGTPREDGSPSSALMNLLHSEEVQLE